MPTWGASPQPTLMTCPQPGMRTSAFSTHAERCRPLALQQGASTACPHSSSAITGVWQAGCSSGAEAWHGTSTTWLHWSRTSTGTGQGGQGCCQQGLVQPCPQARVLVQGCSHLA